MENFYLIHNCEKYKFNLYINFGNPDLVKKFQEINRKESTINKFLIFVEAIKTNVANRTQFNREDKCDLGEIYAIKIDKHRFYTIVCNNNGYKELFMCRYIQKQTQKNDKKINSIMSSIKKISIQKQLI